MPGDPPRSDEPLREPVVGPVDEVRGLTQFFRSGKGVSHSCLVVASVVEGVRGLALVNVGDLVEHLPQRAHPRGQITDHPIHLGGLIETPARVGQASQRLGCLSGVGSRIEERGHGDLLVPCDGEVRTSERKMSVVRPSVVDGTRANEAGARQSERKSVPRTA
jgi:hypothetical protein